jgi:hypothetical protein
MRKLFVFNGYKVIVRFANTNWKFYSLNMLSNPFNESIKYWKGVEQVFKLITKLPNSEQSYKGKVKTHKYINRQNQSTTGKL